VSASPDAALNQLQQDRSSLVAQRGTLPPDPSADIMQQKQAALAPVESAMAADSASLPKPPGPASLPEVPNKPLVDPGEYSKFSAMLVAMGMIAGAKSGNWLGASASLNGALKGYMEGNQQAAEASWKKYQADYDKAVEQHNQQQREYMDILDNKKMSINEKFQQWQIIASKYDDQEKLAIARRKSYDEMTTSIMRADDQIAQLSVRKEGVDNQVNKTRNATTGDLTPGAIEAISEQAEAGDTSAFVGLSKKDRESVRNRMADNAQIRGTNGADQAARNANFVGVKAGERTLGTRQANIDSAVTEAQKVLPILRSASDAVPRMKVTSMNELIQAADRGTSDPALARFTQAARSFSNIYTRAVVPGASGVADREESLKSLPTFTDQKSFNGVLDIMEQEMKAAKESPAAVREDMSRDITNRPPKENAQVPAVGGAGAAPKPYEDPAKEARYQAWKAAHGQ
jgi:hypothetical protein